MLFCCYAVKDQVRFVLSFFISSTGIKKDEDKWGFAYFYLFLLQLILLTIYLTTNWLSLFWTLFPLLFVIGVVVVVLIFLFIGLFRISMKGVKNKRYMTGIAIIGTTSLFFFFYHLVDYLGKGIHHSIILLCCELLIPEVLSLSSSDS